MKKVFLFFIIILISQLAIGQIDPSFKADSTKYYKILLQDGSTFVGKIISLSSKEININTVKNEEIILNRKFITSIEIYGNENDPMIVNPFGFMYFISPSSFSLQKGKFYFQNTYFFINSLTYGITNNISVSTGVELYNTLQGSSGYYIMPKYTIKIGKYYNVGANLLLSKIFSNAKGGVFYATNTIGSVNHNINLGIGYTYVKENDLDPRKSIVYTISGATRLSNRLSLITENWIGRIQRNGLTSSLGIRLFFEKWKIDFALIHSKEVQDNIGIGVFPYFTFGLKF